MNTLNKNLVAVFVLTIFFSALSFAQVKDTACCMQKKMRMKNHKMMMCDSTGQKNCKMMNCTDTTECPMMKGKMDHKNMKHSMMKNSKTNNMKKESIVREGVIDLGAIDKNKDGKVFQDMMDYNVISDKAGKCPLCGMKLKEVSLKEAKEALIKSGYKVK